MIPTAPDPFPAWLRAQLAARGWSAADLARRARTSETTAGHWLAGRVIPAEESRAKLADALGVAPAAVPLPAPWFPPSPDPFPGWLRAELDRRGWTQHDLAERAGVGRASVSHWLHGRRRPGDAAAERIAAALEREPIGDAR